MNHRIYDTELIAEELMAMVDESFPCTDVEHPSSSSIPERLAQIPNEDINGTAEESKLIKLLQCSLTD